jgi:hypothetical protein
MTHPKIGKLIDRIDELERNHQTKFEEVEDAGDKAHVMQMMEAYAAAEFFNFKLELHSLAKSNSLLTKDDIPRIQMFVNYHWHRHDALKSFCQEYKELMKNRIHLACIVSKYDLPIDMWEIDAMNLDIARLKEMQGLSFQQTLETELPKDSW